MNLGCNNLLMNPLFTIYNSQLPLFPDKNLECDYNAINLSPRNVCKYLHNANKQSAVGSDSYLVYYDLT